MQIHEDLDTQLTEAFYRVLCRHPSEADLRLLRFSYEKQFRFFMEDEAAVDDLLGVGSLSNDNTLDGPRHAAMAAVCLGIFNFDEALSRQ